MSVFERVVEVAVDNHGLITVADAADAGIDPSGLRKLAAAGRLEHFAHGIYRLPVLASGPNAAYAGAVAWAKGRGVISHESALDLLGLADVNPSMIHLTVPRDYAPRRRGGELYRVWRRSLPPSSLTHFDGVPVVRAAQTIRDCLVYGTDARLLMQACEAGVREGFLTPAETETLGMMIKDRRMARKRAAHG